MTRRLIAEAVVNALLEELRRRSNFEVDTVLHASLHGAERADRLDLEDELYKVADRELEAEGIR